MKIGNKQHLHYPNIGCIKYVLNLSTQLFYIYYRKYIQYTIHTIICNVEYQTFLI